MAKTANKYQRHQGAHECQRRLKQIATGRLNGRSGFISIETRNAAFVFILNRLTQPEAR